MKYQGLPITTVIIICLGVVVLAGVILFTITTSRSSTDNTDTWWDFSSNLTQNSTSNINKVPTSKLCVRQRNMCTSSEECCDYPTIRCYTAADGGQKTCNTCGTVGTFCTADTDCCYNLHCTGTGPDAMCSTTP